MFDQKVIISQQFPIAQKTRKHTDVCCTIIGVLFALTLFVIAVIVYSPDKYSQKFSLPVQKTCQTGYLHYPDLQNLSIKTCVQVCPQDYGFTEDNICIPYQTKLQQKFYVNTTVMKQKDHEGFIKTLMYSFLVALGLGMIWMVFVFVLPKYAPIAAGASGIFALLLILISTVLSTQNFWGSVYNLRFIPIVLSIILIAILIGIIFSYSGQLKFQGVLLKYSNIFLFSNELTFLYISIFMLLTFGLFALVLFQNMAFQSRYANSNNQWSFGNSGILSVFNIIELLWGLQFLKDSFYFCVGGNAIDWYWKGKTSTFAPMMRLLCRHWGSVVGGSFSNAFFQIPTLIVELLICHPEACCGKAGTVCQNTCNPFTCFFELIRTDAYSYINLSGVPFCDSARNCSHLCAKSKQFVGNHSAVKHYRFLAIVFLTTLLCFMTQFILNYRTFYIGFWNLAIGIALIYTTVMWFVDINASSAEALQVSYMVQYQLEEGYKYMRKVLPSIRGELQFLDSQLKHDGNC